MKRGETYYAGDKLNKSLTAPETVEAVLDRVKSLPSVKPTPPPVVVEVGKPVVVEKPVVADPGELEQSPAKSKTVWTWLLTALGAPVAAFAGLDWRVQLVIVGVIVAFAVYGIKRRVDLFNAVKSLKEEIG